MFIIQMTFTLLLLFVYVESAPIQDASQANPATNLKPEYEQPWVSSPARRGTLDILFACILTLLLCVWTTVHANIEPEIWQRGKHAQPLAELEKYSLDQANMELNGSTSLTSTTAEPRPPEPLPSPPAKFGANLNPKKMIWSVVTLLFPEITLFVAAHERKTANLLREEMHILTRYIDSWDMTLSYYAIMGGFVVELKAGDTSTTSTGAESNLKELEKRCTLTPQGVLHLAQLGKLPHYHPRTVKDKSKANLLGKFLVCFQAIWMIIQVMGRYASRLPVTLLELYTVLHTFCAVAMYIIWIDKPFDVTQPTFIPLSSDELDDLMTNNEVGSGRDHHPTNVFWHHDYTKCLTTRAGLGKLLFRQLWDWHGFKEGGWVGRFLLFLGAYAALWNGWKKFGWEALALSMVGMVHGGLHLAAWDFNFPSPAERKLWKIAALLTAGAVTIFCFSVLIGFLGKSVWDKIRKKIEPPDNGESLTGSIKRWKYIIDWVQEKQVTLRWWFMTIYCIGFVLAIVPCIFARLYLLVESFVSMRKLPYGSYDKVIWSNFLPHVG